jgi:hypothetical protein
VTISFLIIFLKIQRKRLSVKGLKKMRSLDNIESQWQKERVKFRLKKMPPY